MNEKVKLAVIGVGSISQRGILPHLMLEDAREIAELVAVCDIDAQRVKMVAEQFGVPKYSTQYEDILALDDLDAIILATPIGIHYAQAKAALESGRHVYLNKTMTTTTAEADELIDIAHKANLKLAASPGQMISPVTQKIKRSLEEGLIGQVYWAFANTAFMGHEYEPMRDENPIDPTWYYKSPGGGPMYDMAVYVLHTITGVLGPAKRVFAMSGIGLSLRSWHDTTTTVEMDDNTLLMLEFAENCYGIVGGQFCQMGKTMTWGFTGFYGSTGALEINGYLPNTTYPAKIETNPTELMNIFGPLDTQEMIADLPYSFGPHSGITEAHVWMDIRHFIDCVIHDTKPIHSAEHARHVIEIIEKGYLAAETGIPQELTTNFGS
jgi:predicted dehydrogenase